MIQRCYATPAYKKAEGRRIYVRSRPLTVTVATILLALISLLNLLGLWLPGADEIPTVVLYAGIVQGILGFLATVGLWMLRTWGLWLSLVISAINLLTTAPGLVLPDAATMFLAFVGVIVPALTIVLVVLPTSRRAFAAA
jgi:hypothetical protein